MDAFEVNFDGIVGPSHNYAGLSYGNIASTQHGQQTSNPRLAALQGLEKMRFVHQLGIPQAVLPPVRRPRFDLLRSLGFSGDDQQVIDSAWKTNRALLAACYSASSMWAANAATVSPSADCDDGKVHFTPANLASALHRSIESQETTRLLRAIFADESRFHVHEALPSNLMLTDEGAANHSRLCHEYGAPGLELFVFGRSALDSSLVQPTKFPARQTLEASAAVSRRHRVQNSAVMMIQQNPLAIDEGVFHNDVVSVGNQNVFLCHQLAFADTNNALGELTERCADDFDFQLCAIEITADELPIADTVRSYLFNSQLLTGGDGKMILLCPEECREVKPAHACLQRIISDKNPIDRVEFLQLRQSMNNGGGPACLRLRVVLTSDQWEAIHPGVRFSDRLFSDLSDWVNRRYRDEIVANDLGDYRLASEISAALDELSKILQLPPEVLGL